MTSRSGERTNGSRRPVDRATLLHAHLPLLRTALADPEALPDAINAARHDRFLEFGRRHHVDATLAFLLDRADRRGTVSPGVLRALETARAAQAAASRRLLAALEAIGRGLASAGVRWMLLKGVGLAARYYGGLDRRATRDIDVLVRAERLGDAERVLAALGLRRISWAPVRGLALRVTHAFDYAGGDRLVDLHWTLARHPSFRFDLEGLWRRARHETIGSVHAEVPADEDALALYLVSAFSDLQRRPLSARALVDMYRILAACGPAIDWDRFLDERRREGTHAIAINMAALLLDVLEARPSLREAAAVVERHRGIVRRDRDGHLDLLRPSRYAAGNKMWAMGLYDTGPARAIAWWAASLPIRVLVHRGWQQGRSRR